MPIGDKILRVSAVGICCQVRHIVTSPGMVIACPAHDFSIKRNEIKLVVLHKEQIYVAAMLTAAP